MDWTKEQVLGLYNLPFIELVFQAHQVHQQYFTVGDIQISTLLSIKTGSCPEDCKYCPQSAHYNTKIEKQSLMDVGDILEKAKIAKNGGAQRFCMGAAWRSLNHRDLPKIIEIIKQVKSLGLETCMTMGMLSRDQALALKEAGLDYYNHNLDTSEDFYSQIITTRKYEDRLNTIDNIQNAGLKVCCGGIVGMGESTEDRIDLLLKIATLDPYPESVPINLLVKVKGTPLANQQDIDIFDFIRTIAVARIIMPKARIRLSAGRENMTEEAQALCFMAGANSIFYGEKLLVTKNPEMEKDYKLFSKLGLKCSLTA